MKAAVIFWIASILLVDPVTDFMLIKAHRAVRHGRGAIIFLFGVVAPLFLLVATGAKYGVSNAMEFSIVVAVMIPSVRWFVHDSILNMCRGLNVDYFSIAEGAAMTDRLLQWFDDRGFPPMAVKSSALAMSLLAACIVSIIFSVHLTEYT